MAFDIDGIRKKIFFLYDAKPSFFYHEGYMIIIAYVLAIIVENAIIIIIINDSVAYP